MKPGPEVKVSVSVITYNHAPFIAQAIEGALMQQTTFPFEIVVGDDGSTDGTRDIIRALQARFPERIRLILHDRKKPSFANGKPTGNGNLANNIKSCHGQYIALLDGDDFWTSPHKLQKQTEFLDRNLDCSICYHNVRILDENDPARLELHEKKKGKKKLKNLLRGNFMQTCSVMFRSGLFQDFPEWFFESPLGDWPLHVLNAQHGDIGYIDEVMGVYRKHAKAAWSQHSRIDAELASIESAELIRACLAAPDQRHLDRTIARWYRKLIERCLSAGETEQANKLAIKCVERFRPLRSWAGLKLVQLRVRRAFQRTQAESNR
jgi:glycosyltransferase involved in cell wall biosynthesis